MYGSDCDALGMNVSSMPKGQRFQELSEQFETLAHDLSVCQDAKQRKQLLGKMKATVEKMDELTRDQLNSPGSTAQATLNT